MIIQPLAIVLGLLASAHALADASITISASGRVQQPGLHQLPMRSRLSAAADAAQPRADAYLLGAALLRPQQRPTQARLKAGLMFDLENLSARQNDAMGITEAATRMAQYFAPLPITGRVRQRLAPRILEADRTQDYPAQAGDHLFYPPRPTTVTVTGAVNWPCRLAHVPLQPAAVYRRQCQLLRAASKDHVHVIQPDGSVEVLGIALWNRSAPSSLAPGAIILIPLDEALTKVMAPDVNDDAARFLATQLVDVTGTLP